MIRAGLVSITFRQLAPREIVDLVALVDLHDTQAAQGADEPNVVHGRAEEQPQLAKLAKPRQG